MAQNQVAKTYSGMVFQPFFSVLTILCSAADTVKYSKSFLTSAEVIMIFLQIPLKS